MKVFFLESFPLYGTNLAIGRAIWNVRTCRCLASRTRVGTCRLDSFVILCELDLPTHPSGSLIWAACCTWPSSYRFMAWNRMFIHTSLVQGTITCSYCATLHLEVNEAISQVLMCALADIFLSTRHTILYILYAVHNRLLTNWANVVTFNRLKISSLR